jgi:caspase domain-containing protein
VAAGVVRAGFIGIGRFADPAISELTGCARDATALSALFEDTFATIDNRLLINAHATAAAIRDAVTGTLGAATEEDVVILSFATHGTEDHRIVAYDTSLTDLDSTTLPMAVLAEGFRRSRAKFILCILDCCFGGAAPARVVLGTPKSRAFVDFSAFEGAGRLLIAASRLDQPAYEHPTRRHGLLTAALVDAFSDEGHGGVLSIVEAVINRVRTEAAAMGVDQHPVASTYVDGGFALPVLVRGERFRAAFPEYTATYGGYLQTLRDPGFVARMEVAIPQLLHRMDQSGLLQEDARGVHLSALGRACGQSTLGFESCLRLIEALRGLGDTQITPTILLGVTQGLPESDETYVPMQKKGTADLRWSSLAAGRIGPAVVHQMSRGADAVTAAARAKRTLVALAWADGIPIQSIEANFSVNPFAAVAAGDVRGIAESSRFRLRSAYDIAIVGFPLAAPAADAMDAFFRQLEFGIPSPALGLLALPIALSRAEYLLLHGQGLSTPDVVWKVPLKDFESRLSKSLANKLKAWHPENVV